MGGPNARALQLIGGPLIPVAAALLSLVLLGSAGVDNLLAAAVALLIGALIYRFWRRPVSSSAESMDP